MPSPIKDPVLRRRVRADTAKEQIEWNGKNMEDFFEVVRGSGLNVGEDPMIAGNLLIFQTNPDFLIQLRPMDTLVFHRETHDGEEGASFAVARTGKGKILDKDRGVAGVDYIPDEVSEPH